MICKIFQFLFCWPHKHDWELLADEFFENWTYPKGKKEVSCKIRVWTYRCKTCGEANKITGQP